MDLSLWIEWIQKLGSEAVPYVVGGVVAVLGTVVALKKWWQKNPPPGGGHGR